MMEEPYYDRAVRSTASALASANAKQSTGQIQSSEIEQLNKRVDELAARASHLGDVLCGVADRMFGSRPEAVSDNDCRVSRAGRLGDVQDSLDRLSALLDVAAGQADRLTAL